MKKKKKIVSQHNCLNERKRDYLRKPYSKCSTENERQKKQIVMHIKHVIALIVTVDRKTDMPVAHKIHFA